MKWPLAREILLFMLGAAAFLHEVFAVGLTERPFLLATSAALMGLPFVLNADRNLRGGNGSRNGSRTERKPPEPRDEEDRDDRWSHLP